mmetsp:Transcript_92510/g.264287  ORF Transcript_92510/g.264287 Transcript_92510/m.264287 type:complete len:195 (-) Transcript_92510:150-734(-)
MVVFRLAARSFAPALDMQSARAQAHARKYARTHIRTYAQTRKRAYAQELIQRAGDVVFVPAGYFHATLNIGQTVGVACERTYVDPPSSRGAAGAGVGSGGDGGGRGGGRSAQLTLEIPQGARPGQTLQAQGPEGPVAFKVPPNTKPGDMIRLTVPLTGQTGSEGGSGVGAREGAAGGRAGGAGASASRGAGREL